MEILSVRNLTFTYPLCSQPAVRDISFSLKEGELAVLCGATGSGKSTLLRLLKPELSPKGELSGSIHLGGKETGEISPADIGFVMQRPEHQTVTDKVWHELAFGAESIGMPHDLISRRVAEMASYFGIEELFDKSTASLSGGQKQLLCLASAMVTSPELLILDEPTAQLDPITASDFIATIKKLNRDFALTVIICEHRLEEIIPVCDRLMILENGRITHDGTPERVIREIYHIPDIICAMPAAARLSAELSRPECALTVREGRRLVREYKNTTPCLPEKKRAASGKPALEFREVYFRYERSSPDVLRDLSFTVYENEIFCILGGNGSGKTTAIGAASGILKAYSGSISVFGRKIKDYRNQELYRECTAVLPQDVQTVFLKNTVREELSGAEDIISGLPFDLTPLYDRHPYDLSGGEQQLLALAKVLACKPRLLFLDEPTKGIDAAMKLKMTDILYKLRDRGLTLVTVTHDVEFAASCADKCALFFRGGIASCAPPEIFFSENTFYTTAACRITRGHFKRAVTVSDAAELCRINGEV